jgi:hypothetical protein
MILQDHVRGHQPSDAADGHLPGRAGPSVTPMPLM